MKNFKILQASIDFSTVFNNFASVGGSAPSEPPKMHRSKIFSLFP